MDSWFLHQKELWVKRREPNRPVGDAGHWNLKNKANIRQLACWAHARKYFEKELDHDRSRNEYALAQIRALYALERIAREQGMIPEQVKQLRQQKALPVLQQFEQWLTHSGSGPDWCFIKKTEG